MVHRLRNYKDNMERLEYKVFFSSQLGGPQLLVSLRLGFSSQNNTTKSWVGWGLYIWKKNKAIKHILISRKIFSGTAHGTPSTYHSWVRRSNSPYS